jgi:hypothetical protein
MDIKNIFTSIYHHPTGWGSNASDKYMILFDLTNLNNSKHENR